MVLSLFSRLFSRGPRRADRMPGRDDAPHTQLPPRKELVEHGFVDLLGEMGLGGWSPHARLTPMDEHYQSCSLMVTLGRHTHGEWVWLPHIAAALRSEMAFRFDVSLDRIFWAVSSQVELADEVPSVRGWGRFLDECRTKGLPATWRYQSPAQAADDSLCLKGLFLPTEPVERHKEVGVA